MSIRWSGFLRGCCPIVMAAVIFPACAQKVRAVPPAPAPNLPVQTLPNPAGLPSPMPFPAGIPSPSPATTNVTASGNSSIPPSDTEMAPLYRSQGNTYTRVQAPPSSPPPPGPYTALQIAQSFLGADLNRDGELTRFEYEDAFR